jgi:hypothetical protein
LLAMADSQPPYQNSEKQILGRSWSGRSPSNH